MTKTGIEFENFPWTVPHIFPKRDEQYYSTHARDSRLEQKLEEGDFIALNTGGYTHSRTYFFEKSLHVPGRIHFSLDSHADLWGIEPQIIGSEGFNEEILNLDGVNYCVLMGVVPNQNLIPIYQSEEEIKKLFESIKNPKHSFMILLMYSAGLRVSELLNLKVRDLELDKGYGYVRNGKGGKDRLIILSKKLIPGLKRIIELQELNENDLIFKSNRDKKYSQRTIQRIIKKACKRANIKRKIHPHTLRHSFATHLIENGYDVTNVQALLGHKSPETTLIYTHIASPNLINTKSPLDNL